MTRRTCNKTPRSNLTHQNPIELRCDQRIYFRNLFRNARAKAQKSLENFQDLLFALEKLGMVRLNKEATLGTYKDAICKEIEKSALYQSQEDSYYYINHKRLFSIITSYRNDALHQGAVARNLTSRTIQLILLIEDAFMDIEDNIGSFMVSDVVIAELWQPVAFIRQKMLENSFSYIPICHENKWYFLSDYNIVNYLSFNLNKSTGDDRKSKRKKD